MPSFHRSTNLRSDGQAQRHEPISTSTSPSPSPSPLNLTPHRHPGLPDAACNLTLQQSPLSPFPENAYPRLIASNHQQQISVPRLRQRPPRSSITWTSTPIPSESIKRPRLKRARNLSSSAREHAARVRKIGACRSCRSKKIKCLHALHEATSTSDASSDRISSGPSKLALNSNCLTTRNAFPPSTLRPNFGSAPSNSSNKYESDSVSQYVNDPDDPNPAYTAASEGILALRHRQQRVKSAIGHTDMQFGSSDSREWIGTLPDTFHSYPYSPFDESEGLTNSRPAVNNQQYMRSESSSFSLFNPQVIGGSEQTQNSNAVNQVLPYLTQLNTQSTPQSHLNQRTLNPSTPLNQLSSISDSRIFQDQPKLCPTCNQPWLVSQQALSMHGLLEPVRPTPNFSSSASNMFPNDPTSNPPSMSRSHSTRSRVTIAPTELEVFPFHQQFTMFKHQDEAAMALADDQRDGQGNVYYWANVENTMNNDESNDLHGSGVSLETSVELG